MKKTAFLGTLLVLCIVLLTGCGCQHEWQEATCKAAKTCALCGETEGEPAEHTPEAWVVTSVDTQALSMAQDLNCAVCGELIATKDSSTLNGPASKKLIKALEACNCDNADRKNILDNKDYLSKKSQWILGGDGWAYDIGFGGVDHVLASAQDVNILVFDTEVYSNTGGQSSKATPTGAIAQFAAAGKDVKKKDLAAIAMSYGYVYVAQIAQGADYNQCVKALVEAESYPGPSIVIAYAPCINHGIKGGMSIAMTEEKKAVDCGYWQLYRYNPTSIDEGKNPFTLDSKEPTGDYKSFLLGETRYASLMKARPELAEQLFEKTEKDSKVRLETYKNLAKND